MKIAHFHMENGMIIDIQVDELKLSVRSDGTLAGYEVSGMESGHRLMWMKVDKIVAVTTERVDA